jgi:peptide-methionine (R)-S-oxide reductase
LKELAMPNRRTIFASLAALGAGLFGWRLTADDSAEARVFEVTKPDGDWKRELTPEQYRVLRGHGTERAGTSPLNRETRSGTYLCAGCDLPLFSSQTKYESGTGWPSFWQPLPEAIGTQTDRSLLLSRTEVHCRRCGGHLGHVFNDGPRPSGLRYCMNGVALKFQADA